MPVPNSFANVTTSIPLSQLDANFNTPITLGNTAIQLGNTVTTLNNMTLANATVSSGNVTVTSASLSGNLTFTGTGNRITGDFSNATVANRVMFQTSTANSATVVSAIPNGTSALAQIQLFNNSDPTNAGRLQFAVGSTEAQILSSISGTGTYLPMTFYTGGSERMRIDTSGNVGIGTTSPSSYGKLAVLGSVANQSSALGTADDSTVNITNAITTALNQKASLVLQSNAFSKAVIAGYYAAFNGASDTGTGLIFGTQATAAGGVVEQMRITELGNVGIGTLGVSSPDRLTVAGAGETGAPADGGSKAASIRVTSSSGNNNDGGQIEFGAGFGTFSQSYFSAIKGLLSSSTGNTLGSLAFYTRNATGDTSLSERMRITSAGDVAIGTSSVAGKLRVSAGDGNPILLVNGASYGVRIGSTAGVGAVIEGVDTTGVTSYQPMYLGGSQVLFTTSGTERARIDGSGYTQFSSNLVMPYQGAPTSKAGAATLSGAELITGILNTTGTTYTITLPTGANIEGALTWAGNNVSLDWYVINTASGTITIGANGNTTLGSLTIATGTSAHFRIRRTAANTFTVYRL